MVRAEAAGAVLTLLALVLFFFLTFSDVSAHEVQQGSLVVTAGVGLEGGGTRGRG